MSTDKWMWRTSKRKSKTECLLVAQEEKGKSDVWKTFDLVVGTTAYQEKGVYRSERCVSILCQTVAVKLQYYTLF
jgi:hypothetical protein